MLQSWNRLQELIVSSQAVSARNGTVEAARWNHEIDKPAKVSERFLKRYAFSCDPSLDFICTKISFQPFPQTFQSLKIFGRKWILLERLRFEVLTSILFRSLDLGSNKFSCLPEGLLKLQSLTT